MDVLTITILSLYYDVCEKVKNTNKMNKQFITKYYKQ